jgi:dephospho-CoA kinase
MIRAGLTGGLASGKTSVGRILENFGCHVFHADELGHAVLAPGGEAAESVMREFGTIDRRRLAAEVFSNPERLAVLNSLVHPWVIAREERLMAEAAAKDPGGIAVVEAAILIETGGYKRYDRLILVVCTEEQQIQRAMDRDGFTREEAVARLSRQMPLSEKRNFADYVIDTSGTREITLQQTRTVYDALRSLQI